MKILQSKFTNNITNAKKKTGFGGNCQTHEYHWGYCANPSKHEKNMEELTKYHKEGVQWG